MNYIIFDMEWNQPAYSGGRMKVRGSLLTGEVIQIGAVKLDNNFDVCDSFSINIEPVFYKKMNSNVKRITGITEGALRGCMHFESAFGKFLEFCGSEFCFMTWGRDDIPMLKDNLCAHGMSCVSLPKSYDLQLIFNHQVTHSNRQWSLSSAMEILNIEQRHPSHNALFDAINTAKIAVRMDLVDGIKKYDGLIRLIELGRKREVFEGFSDLRSAMGDKSLRRLVCPLCARSLGRGKWVGSREKLVTIADCPEHGTLKFVITAFHDGNGFSASRRVSAASEEMIASYDRKLTAVK